MDPEIQQLRRDLDEVKQSYGDLKRTFDLHSHTGVNSRKVDFGYLDNVFQTVSAAPTNVPKNVYEQVKIYKNGATKRLYIYDTTNAEWDYVALT